MEMWFIIQEATTPRGELAPRKLASMVFQRVRTEGPLSVEELWEAIDQAPMPLHFWMGTGWCSQTPRGAILQCLTEEMARLNNAFGRKGTYCISGGLIKYERLPNL